VAKEDEQGFIPSESVVGFGMPGAREIEDSRTRADNTFPARW